MGTGTLKEETQRDVLRRWRRDVGVKPRRATAVELANIGIKVVRNAQD